MSYSVRIRAAAKAAALHLLGSVVLATLAAMLVFEVWYPHPYALLSGGLNLFLILVGVDVVCGPILTLILFNPGKSINELMVDLSLVMLVQLAALLFGLHTVYQARPLFLVHEIDRFRVITLGDFGDGAPESIFASTPINLKPGFLDGPKIVGIRDPLDPKERQDILFESVFGGRDYSQRPEFYVPYDGAYKEKSLKRSRPLKNFLEKYPEKAHEAARILKPQGLGVSEAVFLPVLHKQDWVAMLNKSGDVLGFLPGDGFEVP